MKIKQSMHDPRCTTWNKKEVIMTHADILPKPCVARLSHRKDILYEIMP